MKSSWKWCESKHRNRNEIWQVNGRLELLGLQKHNSDVMKELNTEPAINL